jgi:hypothetical protein
MMQKGLCIGSYGNFTEWNFKSSYALRNVIVLYSKIQSSTRDSAGSLHQHIDASSAMVGQFKSQLIVKGN